MASYLTEDQKPSQDSLMTTKFIFQKLTTGTKPGAVATGLGPPETPQLGL